MKFKLISVRIDGEHDAALKKLVRFKAGYNEHVRRAVAMYLSHPDNQEALARLNGT